jgi:decaprenylphospho-beta-D-ribofuranose 2-oxidase
MNQRLWPEAAEERRQLRSLDQGVCIESGVLRPDRYRFFTPSGGEATVIPRGAGLSYVAASFGAAATSVETLSFDRVLGFDELTGEVEVEAGIDLAALFRFLITRGCYLAVQPGYGAITVGGCIACDVHGKNPARDGTFSDHVQALRLFHPDHGVVVLSRAENWELFDATCAGFGLTGIILSAVLNTRTLAGFTTDTTIDRVSHIGDMVAQLCKVSEINDVAYAWLDCSRPRSKNFGRGLVFGTRFVPGGNSGVPLPPNRLKPPTGNALPIGMHNCWTAFAINRIYEFKSGLTSGRHERNLGNVLFPIHGNEIYFSLFGRRGFHEYQVLMESGQVSEYFALLKELSSRHEVCISLAAARVFAGQNKLLRFDGRGIGVSIDFPRNAASQRFIADLDTFVLEIGGLPNIYKDSRLPRAVVEATYPQIEKFRAVRRAWDPKFRFRSEVSERLGL